MSELPRRPACKALNDWKKIEKEEEKKILLKWGSNIGVEVGADKRFNLHDTSERGLRGRGGRVGFDDEHPATWYKGGFFSETSREKRGHSKAGGNRKKMRGEKRIAL